MIIGILLDIAVLWHLANHANSGSMLLILNLSLCCFIQLLMEVTTRLNFKCNYLVIDFEDAELCLKHRRLALF